MQRIPEPEYMDEQEEARVYAQADFREVNQAFADRLLSLAPDSAELLALDLGVGPGDIPARILKDRPAWHIIGLDASPAMLAFGHGQAKTAGLAGNLHFLVADAKKLPFPDHSLDLIVSNSILHHVADPLVLWREVLRIQKPGAMIFMRDLFRPVSAAAARHIVAAYSGEEPKLLQEEFYRSLLAAYTPDEVWEQLAAAGLRGLRVETISDRHMDIYGRPEAAA